MIFGSPRQAIAHLYAHRRGPTLARPRYHDAPGETGRSPWTGVLIGALLYGPDGCGITPGSDDDRELQQWASNPGSDRSSLVLRVERRMRRLLRDHGLMRPRSRAPVAREWTDDEGRTFFREPPCNRVQTLEQVT